MRLTTATTAIVCFHTASTLCGGHGFVVSKSAMHRAALFTEGRRNALHADTMDQLDRIIEGPVVDLRGGKTVGKKGKESSPSTGKTKSSKASKSKKKSKKPSFVATVKAFFHSLVNPHFALKLQAKKEQHNTVHG